MRARYRLIAASLLWGCTYLLTGCSPALNWRVVQVAGLKTMLPCKPDRAERSLQLAQRQVTMAMAGCEAAGALYAVSHVHVADTAQTQAVQADWQQAMLANFQSPRVQREDFHLQRPSAIAQSAASAPDAPLQPAGLEVLSVQGQGPDGTALQARLLWLSQGPDLYHVAIYGPALQAEQIGMVFSELALQ